MADWFVHIDGATTGPFPAAHVRQWLSERQLPGTALFWPDGGSAWMPLDQAWQALAADVRPAPSGASAPTGTSPAGAPTGGRTTAGTTTGDAGPNGPATNGTAASGTAASGTPASGPATSGTARAAIGPATGRAGDPVDGTVDLTQGPDAEVYPGHAPYSAPYTDRTGPLETRTVLSAFTDRLSDFAGVERIRGLSMRELFSLAAQKHTRDEIEQNFATGVPGFVPPLDKVESDWPKPWMFVRFYSSASLLFLAFVLMVKLSDNINLLPGMIIVGSFVVPLAVLVFFFEVNTPRNVSLYTVTHAFLVGGVMSLAITLVLMQLGTSPDSGAGPFAVGILEELGKLLAVLVITWRLPGRRYPWILNGMLFGAAVGAGFAAFESAGYALNSLLSSGRIDVDSSINVIFLRGALAPFGHVVWAALVAGALWRVKRDRSLSVSMLLDLRVLRILGLVIGLHILWDLDVQLPFLLKYALLGILAWVVVLGMITSGLKQIKATQVSAATGGPSLPMPTAAQPRVDLPIRGRTGHDVKDGRDGRDRSAGSDRSPTGA